MIGVVQRVMHCRCGRTQVVAHGLCGTCYTLKWQDRQHFGGLRERVLVRDGHRCRICARPGGRKHSLAVHHRIPGRSELPLMITLCLKHHAMVSKTLVLRREWPPLLATLWREQHPDAHEQLPLTFSGLPMGESRFSKNKRNIGSKLLSGSIAFG